MSLYYDAARFLENAPNHGGSLKSRVYGAKDLKSKPAHVYALIAETVKWSPVLREVIEKADFLASERKLTPVLSLLLVHDLLLAKSGVAAAVAHPLKVAITRHKARLQAEFTKARIRRGFSSVEELKASVKASGRGLGGSEAQAGQHPRWVRVNAIRTSLEEQLPATFAGYKRAETLREVMEAAVTEKILHVDGNIPSLLALPPGTDLTGTTAYTRGEIILQDKASCFPAHLLDPAALSGDVIDACAAPGNKTTHLAAFVSSEVATAAEGRTIYACERDKIRSETLAKMVEWAGAGELVQVNKNQDFLRISPEDRIYANVGAILLDPSCSGSGIVGRDDALPQLELPSRKRASDHGTPSAKSKKRKRGSDKPDTASKPADPEAEESAAPPEDEDADKLNQRLASLSAFQLKLLLHAFRFPAARRVVYSTCSVHAEENEMVVFKALKSSIAKERGWRILKREEQVDGLRRWPHRGVEVDAEGLDTSVHKPDVVEACIRCNKGGDGEGTMGFFVAGFVRDGEVQDARAPVDGNGGLNGHHGREIPHGADEDEEEWNGFDDD